MRALLYGLVILHAGPGIAFALVAFGCGGADPWLGAACGKGVFSLFALLTTAGWLVVGLATAAAYLVQRARSGDGPRIGLRAWALLALAGSGAALGATGAWLTGNDAWWLAVPAALAAGWLFLANPLTCEVRQTSAEANEGDRVPSETPLTEAQLREYESRRDLAADLLESVQQMKTGQTQVISPASPQAAGRNPSTDR